VNGSRAAHTMRSVTDFRALLLAGGRPYSGTGNERAAGSRRLMSGVRDPLCANTSGVGEMLLDATRRGARQLIIGLGGSATNDGGFGMARALGFRFFADQKEVDERTGRAGRVNENFSAGRFTFAKKYLRQQTSEIRCSANAAPLVYSAHKRACMPEQIVILEQHSRN